MTDDSYYELDEHQGLKDLIVELPNGDECPLKECDDYEDVETIFVDLDRGDHRTDNEAIPPGNTYQQQDLVKVSYSEDNKEKEFYINVTHHPRISEG